MGGGGGGGGGGGHNRTGLLPGILALSCLPVHSLSFPPFMFQHEVTCIRSRESGLYSWLDELFPLLGT